MQAKSRFKVRAEYFLHLPTRAARRRPTQPRTLSLIIFKKVFLRDAPPAVGVRAVRPDDLDKGDPIQDVPITTPFRSFRENSGTPPEQRRAGLEQSQGSSRKAPGQPRGNSGNTSGTDPEQSQGSSRKSKEREGKCQTHAIPFVRVVSTRPVVNAREGELSTKGRVRKQIEGAHARRRSERKTMSSPSKLGWRESLKTMRWKKW